MIHTKLLIRRLAYVPWLLAAGLVLGWAGEAAAQQVVTLKVSPSKVREDAGETNITVTAKVSADAPAAQTVTLSTSALGLNTRYRIVLPTLVIPKGKKEISETIVLSPINDKMRGTDYNNAAESATEDLTITITGEDGATGDNPTATITLIDDRQAEHCGDFLV